ncbi:MAG: tyrosine-type recombinase/integrase [Lachnospira sp.]|nr:tyrosine-type recombinase/integrase [Lachnospira sp.]
MDNELNDDLSFSRRKAVISNQIKGGTSRGYRKEYLTDEAIKILEKARKLNPTGEYLFEPARKLMSTDRFNRRLKKYCEECGIKYHSSHKIRFYCASTAYDGKILLLSVSLWGIVIFPLPCTTYAM